MHTTADDPTKYRPDNEVDAWKSRDPIARVRKYLVAKSLWNDDKEAPMGGAEEDDRRRRGEGGGVQAGPELHVQPRRVYT